MTTHFFGDTAVLTGRSLRHITRSLDTIITTTIMPIALHAAVRLRVRRRDQTRVAFVRELPAARHPAHHDRFGHLLHRVPALPGHAERHLRAVPVHADRTVVRAVGARADLAGRQSDLARGRRARRPPHGLPLGGGSAGVARGRRHPGPVHPGADVDRRDPRPLREVRGRRERVLLPAHLPAVHQLGVRAHRTPCPARCAPSPSTSR